MSYIIKGNKADWEVIMGLEIHAQVNSNSKLFSTSSTKFGAEQNTQVSLVDVAMPGMLPVINSWCVDQAIRTGIGLNAEINLVSVFDRKNYFYQDLPQGYQISQFQYPIVGNGVLTINFKRNIKDFSKRELNEKELNDNKSNKSNESNKVNEFKESSDNAITITKDIRITRIHLEQDAGKSIHDQSPSETFVDLNRSGIALMEIVTEPDFRAPDEVAEFVKKLRSILRYLNTCDGDMEKGSLRCDVNISVREVGSNKLGTRVEIKNLNSIKHITKAIYYEAENQVEKIEAGEKIQQETKLFDISTGETKSMRSKEDAEDYRYFPDPDLLPLIFTKEHVDNIRANLPELPDQRRCRYIKEIGLSEYDADIIISDKSISEYFENIIKLDVDIKLATSWLTSELFGRLNKAEISIEESAIKAENLVELLKMIMNGTISGKIAKYVFDIMFNTGDSAKNIVERESLQQMDDVGELEKIINDIVVNNNDKVIEYKSGKNKLFGFFVGQVMQMTSGKGNPNIINEILIKKLNEPAK